MGVEIRCVFDGFVVGVIVLSVGLSKGHYRTLHLCRNLKLVLKEKKKSINFGYARVSDVCYNAQIVFFLFSIIFMSQ